MGGYGGDVVLSWGPLLIILGDVLIFLTKNLNYFFLPFSFKFMITDHLLKCNCSVDFDDFDFLASDAHKFRLLSKETLFINHDLPQLNKTA